MFKSQLAHHHEALHKQQLVYCVRIMSAGCYQVWSGTPHTLWSLKLTRLKSTNTSYTAFRNKPQLLAADILCVCVDTMYVTCRMRRQPSRTLLRKDAMLRSVNILTVTQRL
jgi:hypothetical protein